MNKSGLWILLTIWCIAVSLGAHPTQSADASSSHQTAMVPLGAQPIDSLWMQAIDAYSQANYPEAFEIYQSIYHRGLVSAALYYNMGNCAFRMSQKAEAILWYERAKLLEPKNKDVIDNLHLINSLITNKIEPIPEFFLQTWGRNVRNHFSANQWAWLALLLFAGALSLTLLFFFGRSRSARRWAFYTAIFVMLLSLCAFSFGMSHKQEITKREYAIVLAPRVSVKSAPDRQGKELFIINDGTKVRIMELVGVYGRIELADGRQGWMEISQAERI